MWLKVHFWRHAELLVIHMQPFLILIHLRKQTHFCKQSRKVGLLRWYSLMPETHFISTTSYIMLYLYPKGMKGYSFIYRGLNHCYPCLIKGLELLHQCFHISLDRPSFFSSSTSPQKNAKVLTQSGQAEGSFHILQPATPVFHRWFLCIFQVMQQKGFRSFVYCFNGIAFRNFR